MTISEWQRRASAMLVRANIDSAPLEARVLLAHAIGKDRTWILANPDADFEPGSAEELLRRRLAHEPLAYITEIREFFGRTFKVGPEVLIPRQETETLVEHVLETAPRQARLIDIGTGSGCIALTIKLERPDLEVIATDISSDALKIAKENRAMLQVDVDLIESDLFPSAAESFDLVVSNPPYVESGADLAPEVKLFEPALALFGGEFGMNIYERLAREASAHLLPNGKTVVEIGDGQGDRVKQTFETEGWIQSSARNDLLPKLRVLEFSRP